MATWDAFKAHRTTCAGHLWAAPQTPPAPALTEADLDRLADLYQQLDDLGGAPVG